MKVIECVQHAINHICRFWKRVCWVLDLWQQADLHQIVPKPMTEYGWHINNDSLTIDWDCDSNMKAINERVAGLLKGRCCKTGCETRQCGCKKNDKKCSEGCNCAKTHMTKPNYKKRMMT